ncbi:MAG TPA: hypothetical protein VFQ45_20110, partial [Longimicrobium sp.]|nr:hypothetical protein [Longimicrobium sp.]
MDSTHSGMGPGAHLLSNGRYCVLVTAAGGGCSTWDGFALTRWTADRTRDCDGFFVYLRDLDTGDAWSAGYQPTGRAADAYAADFAPGLAMITRTDGEVETRTEVCVAGDADAELRRITLTNRGAGVRRIEVTTYAELVLNTAAGDAGHPAFSKLFVQTADEPGGGLLAWRRLRSPDDAPLWLAHRLLGPAGDPQHETDRARFIGRGRSLASPAALDGDARLSRTTGNVLDPVFSLRRTLVLQPGASLSLVALLAAGPTRDEAMAAAERLSPPAAVRAEFERAAAQTEAVPGSLAVPAAWLRHIGHLPPPPTSGDEAAARYRPASPAAAASPEGDPPGWGDEELRFWNGVGGFGADGREYVIRLRDGRERPPLPWTNVIANEQAGFIVSESGAAHTWAANSRENRLTPWSNDPVSDPHAEALYLRDEDAGDFWSPTPGPVPGEGPYEVRHGFGYTAWRHAGQGLAQETVTFADARHPLRFVRLRITNRGDAPRRLSVFSYAQWVLGGLPQESGQHVETELDAAGGALFAASRRRGEFSGRAAFAAVVAPPGSDVSCTADRGAFLGAYGSAERPAAVLRGERLDGRTGVGLDPCAAFQVPLVIAPGATAEVAFLLGEARDEAAARALVERYSGAEAVAGALDEARAAWDGLLDRVRVETPSPEIDLAVNGWLAYQNLGCRIQARSAFYQSGGAFGFRDQLQDSSALVYLDPARTREQILLHAAHQFVEGDVLHWWHPPLS